MRGVIHIAELSLIILRIKIKEKRQIKKEKSRSPVWPPDRPVWPPDRPVWPPDRPVWPPDRPVRPLAGQIPEQKGQAG